MFQHQLTSAVKIRSNSISAHSFVMGAGLPLSRSKRAFDLAVCILALPLLALATLFVAVLTSLTSPGPIFFQQERVGYRGRKFRLYKFRTMHATAPTAPHRAHFAELVRSKTPMQKMDSRGDARLIPGGWFLRATGLDELPQLLNVLRGEMSVVGPRPCIPYEYEQFTVAQRERFTAVPGLTGLWQVSGKNRTTFEKMVALDIDYARNQSLTLDFRIVALTLPAVVGQLNDQVKLKRASRLKHPMSSNTSIRSAHVAR